MSEWQPIKTAPKDGTVVLLYFPEDRTRENREYHLCKPFINTGVWAPNLGCWHDIEACDYPSAYEDLHPTHWMPLPEPPK